MLFPKNSGLAPKNSSFLELFNHVWRYGSKTDRSYLKKSFSHKNHLTNVIFVWHIFPLPDFVKVLLTFGLWQHYFWDFLLFSHASKWAIMKPIEVENVGVVNIFGKSFLGQQKIGKTPFSAINEIFTYFISLKPVSYTHLTLPTKRIV